MSAATEAERERTSNLMKFQRQAGLGSISTPESQLSETEHFDDKGKFDFAIVDGEVISNRIYAWVLAGYQRLKELGVKANWGERKFTKQGKKFALVISDDL